jgi:hypothetical protein
LHSFAFLCIPSHSFIYSLIPLYGLLISSFDHHIPSFSLRIF